MYLFADNIAVRAVAVMPLGSARAELGIAGRSRLKGGGAALGLKCGCHNHYLIPSKLVPLIVSEHCA